MRWADWPWRAGHRGLWETWAAAPERHAPAGRPSAADAVDSTQHNSPHTHTNTHTHTLHQRIRPENKAEQLVEVTMVLSTTSAFDVDILCHAQWLKWTIIGGGTAHSNLDPCCGCWPLAFKSWLPIMLSKQAFNFRFFISLYFWVVKCMDLPSDCQLMCYKVGSHAVDSVPFVFRKCEVEEHFEPKIGGGGSVPLRAMVL